MNSTESRPSLLTTSIVGQAAVQFADDFLVAAHSKGGSPSAVLIGLFGAAEIYAARSGLSHNQVKAARVAAKRLREMGELHAG